MLKKVTEGLEDLNDKERKQIEDELEASYQRLKAEREHKDATEKLDEDDDELNPRNFLSQIYQNDEFLSIKAQIEQDLIEQTKLEMDRKSFLRETDDVLSNLQKWKDDRKTKEVAVPKMEFKPAEQIADFNEANYQGHFQPQTEAINA